jgi:ABC-2 type transport system permease protein
MAAAVGSGLRLPALGLEQAARLALSLVLAYLLCFLLKALLGMTAFWVTEVGGLIGLWEICMFVLGGTLYPLELLPAPLGRLADVLPFRYLLAFPLGLALGRLDDAAAWFGLAVQLGWLLVALALARWGWTKALRRYEAVGQ